MSETLQLHDTGGLEPNNPAGNPLGDDLSALSWVQAELRRSLEAAHKALRRQLKEADAVRGSDVGSVDPSVLRTARNQLHQSVGALELVGLPAAADMLRGSEAAVTRMVSKPAMVDTAAVETIEKASFALLDFLARQLAGKPVSPVMLFPQYRAVLQLAAAERIHPADLWKIDWAWQALPADLRAEPLSADDAARSTMETLVLALMRPSAADGGQAALMHMSDLCAGLGVGARLAADSTNNTSGGAELASFWQLAAAVFEAQSLGLLPVDVYSKRIASGMLAQLRLRVKGHAEVPARQAHDLLFFCSHARVPDDLATAPRLMAVRQSWQLDSHPTADYETARLGRFDPAVLALARKRVAIAKDSWSAVAGGELHRMAGLPEQFILMGESLQRMFPEGKALDRALQAAVAQTVAANAEPPPGLAMEVATAILYVDASMEDAQFDHPELASRVQHLARRIDDVRIGADPQVLETWMEELYRRVSDRQTMGSVVQELRASLSEIEKQIDAYFREPARRDLLIPVPNQLSAMRGVLSVLGMDQASQAALHMRDEVEALAQTEVDPQRAVRTGTFDRLADNLGALSFLIDMLSVQPQLAKSLFRFDPATGSLSAVMGQSERVSAFAAFETDESELQLDLREAVEPVPPPAMSVTQATDLSRFVSETTIALPSVKRGAAAAPVNAPGVGPSVAPVTAPFAAPAGAATLAAPAPAPAFLPPLTPTTSTGLEDDAEMREIFIEEAREVITDAQAALERLVDAPDNSGDLTALRRAFHTLKGSARMVGLRDFGEAGWACEQLYNDRLASAPRLDHPLRVLTAEALAYLADWTEAIAEGRDGRHHPAAVAQAADALRLRGERLAIVLPSATAAVGALEAPEALAFPDLSDLPELPELPELPALQDAAASTNEATITLPPPAVPPEFAEGLLSLDFDLLDDVGEAEPAPTSVERTLPLDNTLSQRVPGLPSAADLDLDALTIFAAPPVPPSSEISFDLDLNTLDAPDAPADDMQATAPLPYGSHSNSLLNLPLDPVPFASPAPPPAAHADASANANVIPEAEALEIDFDELGDIFGTAPEPEAEPMVEAVAGRAVVAATEAVVEPLPESVIDQDGDEQVKVIGPLRISIPLFNIYLNEADEVSRRLGTELAEWSLEWERHAVPETTSALAHQLAGNSATVGYLELSALARALEHALLRSHAQGRGRPGEAALFNDAADDIRRLLHQFAAGFLRSVAPALMDRLAAHERLPMTEAPEAAETPQAESELAVVDAIDTELFPIFEEEAEELLPQLQSRLSDWLDQPDRPDAAMACMRTLHTLKGGARLSGAMRLGEMAHCLETAIETLAARGHAQSSDVAPLLAQADAMSAVFDAMRKLEPPAATVVAPVAEPRVPAVLESVAEALEAPVAAPVPDAERPVTAVVHAVVEDVREPVVEPVVEPAPEPVAASVAESPIAPIAPIAPAEALQPAPLVVAPLAIDWQRFANGGAPDLAGAERATTLSSAVVRVRAGLLDRLVNQAGEVSITRARIDTDVKQMQSSLGDLTDSLERMRRQLRDIELQAETQITTRIEAAKAAAQDFDPLEMDRFTRFQELTRFMAESVNDVATLQRSLQRTLQSTEDELAAQARLTRELQDDLLRTRMIEFDSIAERLSRTVRQAAKETAKQVKVDIVGGAIEIDRGVLERMVGSFEHLLRNSVAHGVETPAVRSKANKDATGVITITVAQAGNEVAVEFADDGAGLDLARIRQRGIERKLIDADAQPTESELAGLIFAPGFSTAETVTELAGRGVGLDVVRAEVNAMGGRIETASLPGQGTRFKLLLPLTTAVTQVVMLRCGDLQVAVPSQLVELVRRAPRAEVERSYDSGSLDYGGQALPFYWLPTLLRTGTRGEVTGNDRSQTVVIVRSAAQRVAVHVDEVLGNQEVVVKNVGPQLARLPGLAGLTLLPSGAVALIYNPVALASLYGEEARARQLQQVAPEAAAALATAAEQQLTRLPMVLVVDDSLTVRRVTQRLLVREGYRVVLAKDGLDALERLAEERPCVLLSDIEMPRMDGFDLVRNVRADAKLAGLPVVMITSRIAQKHRDYAAELGVQHYLGKPFSEEELLSLVARYARVAVPI